MTRKGKEKQMANALKGAVYTGTRRVTGAASFVCTDGKVKFTFLTKEDNNPKYPQPKFSNGDMSAIFDQNSLPIKFQDGTEDVVIITLNPDGDKIDVIAPYEGVYSAKFVNFSRPNGEGTPPMWTEEEKTFDAKTYTVLKFVAYFELTRSKEFKGVKIPFFMRYMFQDGKDGFASWAFTIQNGKAKKSTNGQRLMDFCEKLNTVNEPISWPEDGNVLPELERRALAYGKEVKVTISKGWMDSFTRVSSFGSEEARPETEILQELGAETEPKVEPVSNPDEM